MTKSIPTPKGARAVSRLRSLEPLDAVCEILGWWPSMNDAVAALQRYLPRPNMLDTRALYAWRRRGIPRSRQTVVMRAVKDDFKVTLDLDLIERLTQDRIAASSDATSD